MISGVAGPDELAKIRRPLARAELPREFHRELAECAHTQGVPDLVRTSEDITPSASRLTGSLRDIGYDFPTAVADLIDNSVSAEADRVDIDFVYAGNKSHILITDNGHGMTAGEVTEALRFGTRKSYSKGDLGRFGLGLKTASLSQARRLSVVSRHAPERRWITKRTLDLDFMERTDRWRVFEPREFVAVREAVERLQDGPGTVIVLEKLDRLFDGVNPESGWGERRLDKAAEELNFQLGMIFHRFIEGTAASGKVTILVNGEKVVPWNPFAPTEESTKSLGSHQFSLADESGINQRVTLRPFVLPPRSEFSSPAEFDRLGGPKRWNRQQGLYIYRSDRLVQSGGWSGLRSFDEHTKLARAALEFPVALDHEFKINVAKMRVSIPSALRESIARPVNELAAVADATYRNASVATRRKERSDEMVSRSADISAVAAALKVAALESGRVDALLDIAAHLSDLHPTLAKALTPAGT